MKMKVSQVRRKFTLLILCLSGWIFCLPVQGQKAGLPNLSSGKVERMVSFPSKFTDSRNIDVWLPAGYNSKTKYAVLYLHDGQMLFDTAKTWNHQEWGVDETAGKIIRQGKTMPFIVVGIWNITHLRFSDYYPAKPFNSMSEEDIQTVLGLGKSNFGTSLPGGQPQSDNYLKFIVEELKPAIDKKYSTYTDDGHTFIGGSSMGGLISMYAICEYPQVFGGAACLSTHWPGIMNSSKPTIGQAFINYLATNFPDPKTHRFYFDHGTLTIDSLYGPFQHKADSVLKSKGFGRTNYMSRVFKGEPHIENAWRKRLEIPLIFLLSQPVPTSRPTKKVK